MLERRQAALGARGAILVTSAPLVWVGLAWAQKGASLEGAEASLVPWLAGGSSALLVLSAWLLARARSLAFWVLPLGLLAGAAPFVLVARQAPDVAFVSLSWGVLLAYFVTGFAVFTRAVRRDL